MGEGRGLGLAVVFLFDHEGGPWALAEPVDSVADREGAKMSKMFKPQADLERLYRKVRGGLMVVALAVVAMATVRTSGIEAPTEANGDSAQATHERREVALLHADIESARDELRLAAARLERWNKIFGYSRRYGIPADLASAIYDAAINERIDPALAFPLVRLESRFDERAVSPVGASGLTQLMLPTAREFDPTVTKETIFDRETNLRIGFRYLHKLIRWQKGDVEMALLAYNRGPAAVAVAKDLALDASNGYDSILLRGYKGRGILD